MPEEPTERVFRRSRQELHQAFTPEEWDGLPAEKKREYILASTMPHGKRTPPGLTRETTATKRDAPSEARPSWMDVILPIADE